MNHYILNENDEPIPEEDLMKWGTQMEKANRRVARSTVGRSTISTIFLGSDHNWTNEGPPILWETMVFGGDLDGECERCSGSRKDAEAMHRRMVERARGAWRNICGRLRRFFSRKHDFSLHNYTFR